MKIAIAGTLTTLSLIGNVNGANWGWGIDACLTSQLDRQALARYLTLLQKANIATLREREPRQTMRELKANGNAVVAFIYPPNIKPRADNYLPEDLQAVYTAARDTARKYYDIVDAWEMVGEADVGYCTDLPDRVAAYQKAVYLGIIRGAADAAEIKRATRPRGRAALDGPGDTSDTNDMDSPVVLMGALALPPGPWLERAVNNQLLEYTDAYNFHFYGNAEDLSGVIAAHARVARRTKEGIVERSASSIIDPEATNLRMKPALPLWITECGIDAVSPSDFANPERREMQANFTIDTARQALSSKAVAMFMPFILVHREDPHAMTLSPDKPLPAWEAYARFIANHPWPKRPVAAPRIAPDPVIVQWMPDFGAAVAHKVSGTYRFWQRQPMRGNVIIYNFSSETVVGKLHLDVPIGFREANSPLIVAGVDLNIPSGQRVAVPITFAAPPSGYLRGDCECEFKDLKGRDSKCSFGLETWPEFGDFIESPISIRSLPGMEIRHAEFLNFQRSGGDRTWLTINGLRAEEDVGGRGTWFWVDRLNVDPLMPQMAFAAVAGLPEDGFLRMKLDRPMAMGRSVRVDLVDAAGQRFCIWENLGQNYFVKSSEIWLNIHDMQVYFWGRCTADPRFNPRRVTEIQLWFFRKTPGEKMRIELSWMTPCGMG